MLSGEDNENGEKTTITKKRKNFARAAHFVVVLHDYNVKRPKTWKLPGYTVYGGKFVHVLVRFFFTAAHFSLGRTASISHFLTAVKNSCCSSNEKWLLISRSSSPSLIFSFSFSGLSPIFSFSLFFSFTIF